MGWYRERILPRAIDYVLDVRRVHELRSQACSGLSGDVLEIGFGSGLNVYHYPRKVDRVWAVEPSDLAWRLAQRRIYQASRDVTRGGLDAEQLAFSDDTFDAVLSTFTLCTVPDLDGALAEVSRVLRPGGALHFLEHGRSPEHRVAMWQDVLEPLNERVAGGCHLDRPIAEHVNGSELKVDQLATFYDAGPKPFAFMFLGTARKAD